MQRPASLRIRTPRATAVVTLLLALAPSGTRAGAMPSPAALLARGKMLVASEQLPDPSFRRAVILLLEYEASGALGVIVNRPTDVTLDSVLPDVAELKGRSETIFLGGPVARDRMILLVRMAKPPEPSAQVLDGLFITPSFEVLRELARGPRENSPFRAFAGYAGWGPGQLDAEVGRGDWDVVPGDAARVIAREPAKLWDELHEHAQGEWVRGTPPGAPAAHAAPALVASSAADSGALAAQRSSGGVALPPPARNACRASTLAFTS